MSRLALILVVVLGVLLWLMQVGGNRPAPNDNPGTLLWPESQQGDNMAYYLHPLAPYVPVPQAVPGVAWLDTAGAALSPILPQERAPSDRSGRAQGRVLSDVRLTYYTDRGPTRTGPWVFPGAASVDPRILPHGTLFRVVGDDTIRVALDTGGLVVGAHVDLWMPSDEDGRAFLRRSGTTVDIEILQEVP